MKRTRRIEVTRFSRQIIVTSDDNPTNVIGELHTNNIVSITTDGNDSTTDANDTIELRKLPRPIFKLRELLRPRK